MASDALSALEGERYISLETYRADGTAVRTPVWFARHGGAIVVVTPGDSYKVKRLRRNPALKLAACNINGKRIKGLFYDGAGDVIEDPAERDRAIALLRGKYGLQWRIFELSSRLAGRRGNWVILRIAV